MPILILHAPLAGWCAPLEEVPDPVFAGHMLGDGIAIDPTCSIVIAPCDGEVTSVPTGGHAVSIRTTDGIDVLIHVGIDTVQLRGRGFETLVRPGEQVRTGDELLRFDLDVVARTAKSLMTPIVVTPAPGVQILKRHAPGPIRAGEALLELSYRLPVATPASICAQSVSRILPVPFRHGLHARPAALLVQRLGTFSAQVTLSSHGKSASARSVVALLGLGVQHGDDITITASGADATAALEALIAGFQDVLKLESNTPPDPHAVPAEARSVSAGTPLSRAAAASAGVPPLTGIVAVSGFAVGPAVRIAREEIAVVEAGQGVAHESSELQRAQGCVRARLSRMAISDDTTRRDIVATHLAFLDDPVLNEGAREEIAAGKSAAFAWRAASRRSIAALAMLDDARLRERGDDLLDIESHVLLALGGDVRPLKLSLPEHAVLVADDLLPSELVALDRQRVAAICLGGGGPTSHVAILAAAMDVPMLVGIGPAIRDVPEAALLIVDAEQGWLHVAPPAALVVDSKARIAANRARRLGARAAALRECRTRDGTRIEVFANLGSVADAETAVASGAEGCGLLRTEFLFIDRETAPEEAEQLEVYQRVATALGGRPLVLRLMDVGGDKPLKYLPLPTEENPALGLRGIRTALWRPDLLRTQLRAALRVKPEGVVRILLPMITDVAEVQAVLAILEELRVTLGGRAPVTIGAMIETPAAALMAERIAAAVDFLSIGSNDLTQYALAMDRGHPQLARRSDALHPAVLKLIAATAGAADGKTVAVCGGMAADPAAVPLLVGFGVRELSVVPAAIPALKEQIRTLVTADCASLAVRALKLGSAEEVRALVAQDMQTREGAP
jgi:phosphocarrier protein FPr/phosphocarrier protein